MPLPLFCLIFYPAFMFPKFSLRLDLGVHFTLTSNLTWILNICPFPIFSSHPIKNDCTIVIFLILFSPRNLVPEYVNLKINMNDEITANSFIILWGHLDTIILMGRHHLYSSYHLKGISSFRVFVYSVWDTLSLWGVWFCVCMYLWMYVCLTTCVHKEPNRWTDKYR